MPEPWWTWIIAPEALRAGLILAAIFLAAWTIKWWRKRWIVKVHWARRGVGVCLVYIEPPWPIHLELGRIVVDVVRR